MPRVYVSICYRTDAISYCQAGQQSRLCERTFDGYVECKSPPQQGEAGICNGRDVSKGRQRGQVPHQVMSAESSPWAGPSPARPPACPGSGFPASAAPAPAPGARRRLLSCPLVCVCSKKLQQPAAAEQGMYARQESNLWPSESELYSQRTGTPCAIRVCGFLFPSKKRFEPFLNRFALFNNKPADMSSIRNRRK